MNAKSNGVLIIPSLNPDEKLGQVLSEAFCYFDAVILVNDGSDPAFSDVFTSYKAQYGDRLHLLTHEENAGKGKALKTAFSYYLSSPLCKQYKGVVTADSDGQHATKDVVALDAALGAHPQCSIHIGRRNLSDPSVPLRSRFGNKVTALLFRALYGVALQDTQTGLRAFSNDVVPWLLTVKGDRFEYEMNVLIRSRDTDFTFYEHPIETKYEADHKSTFRTVRDAARVLSVLLGGIVKYVGAALAAAVADIGLFYLLRFHVLPSSVHNATALLISTVVGRAVSSVINFAFNRFITFGGKEISRASIVKYYVLWACQMAASYGLVVGFTSLIGEGELATTLVKLTVDLCLALVSYQLQLKWVFAKKKVVQDENCVCAQEGASAQ